MKKFGISPLRSENYPEWYQEVIKSADLAENSDVRGCMVIKPWGYAIWEAIQRNLDKRFKDLGHQNAYFPLFIPLKYFEKEATHVEGFAKECAVVTHSRLTLNEEGRLVPSSRLEEPLVVRPTSETIIGESFSRWVHSYRDLPIKINQWANIVRWEMRTRLFLRTAEILWQEGHTVHATKEEAEQEAIQMLQCYKSFVEEVLAVPVLAGEKTEMERFPGAVKTLCIEMMMQDKKSLQAGTSHFLGQNFARASNIQFTNESGTLEYAWTTSWGASTRLIGGMTMVHSDDDGLILPPRLAPQQVVILPVIHHEEDRSQVLEYCNELQKRLSQKKVFEESLRCQVDSRDLNGGVKKWEWIKKGVPLILEIGPRDISTGNLCITERYTMLKKFIPLEEFVEKISDYLVEIQKGMFLKAQNFRDENTKEIFSKDELIEFFQNDGGYALTYFSGDREIEEEMKKLLNITIRCIPQDMQQSSGQCIFKNIPTSQRVIWAKSY